MRFRMLPALLLAGLISCKVATGQQESAGEGRPITPAGTLVMDAATHLPAVGAMPMTILRSPDALGRGGKGRYLLVVNSGFGVQFSEATNEAQQSIAVIDLNASPEPMVIQNIYFPTPQSANVGLAFSRTAGADGTLSMYVSGGFENKVWIFRFDPKAAAPVQPGSPGPDTKVTAPSFLVSNPGETSPKDYNKGKAALYPTGLGLAPDGKTLVVANNLGDSVTIVRNVSGSRKMQRVDLHRPDKPQEYIYPYGVMVLGNGKKARVYVSCWNDSSIAVIGVNGRAVVEKFIGVDRHPTAMISNAGGTRIFVANSNADSVSVIDTAADQEIERIDVRLAENALTGSSPEGLALSDDEKTLYVANAHSNAIAVVALSEKAHGEKSTKNNHNGEKSKVLGFIPTGQYPSAVAVADGRLFIGNGKGTGFEPSSMRVNNSGRTPNPPNAAFPPNKEKNRQGGEYSGAIVSGNISVVPLPDDPTLAHFTQQTMQNDGLMDFAPPKLFAGASPIKHIIYIIKENRTYDQVFGDVKLSGDGHLADGQPDLAIFGGGEAARRPSGATQSITPNQHALAQRFGLFDRFFVNSEASPDGHNWSTAAFSTDAVDKGFRWAYSGRGRTYDWEGFNRLPDYEPPGDLDLDKFKGDALEALSDVLVKHIPYRQGSIDWAEPKTLYLWDAAARAGLTYRNYGEFVAVISEKDVETARQHAKKAYPDISKAARAIPTKESLANHHSLSFRSFDVAAPDSMTVDCYKAALAAPGAADAAVTHENSNPNCTGNSRLGEWLAEFREFVAQRETGKPDPMPAFNIVRFPNDHTTGIKKGFPTPQFMVADNDYAVGRLLEAISSSVYWKDTAIFVVEDDAQSGPDHVDSHRSAVLAISAYNKPGALIHKFHSTVSMIRTMEMLLGIAPMNQLDASAIPMDIFQETPNLAPYKAILPTVAADNLLTEKVKDKATAEWMKKSNQQDFTHADMANAQTLNAIIWFACRGSNSAAPQSPQLPAYQALRFGIPGMEDVATRHKRKDDDDD
ncbi:MAG TPA: bifunctional YncE family protein/alkaline phosphatase family protein [Methylomirabilota bacterium]|nr:bifunctional YncE family protein/alkaline phosphatase family protein [Methylomirabilota bacterium]